jgi:ComF family protein
MQVSISHKSGLIPKLINYLYPSDCPSCGNSTDSVINAPFCTLCWSSIKKYSGPSCKICSTTFSSEESFLCAECLKKPPVFSKAINYGLYDGVLATAINIFKFHRIKRLYKPLGKLLFEFDIKEIDAIIPVPLSIRGLRDRGFNQSLLLSKIFSDYTKIPVILDGLVKTTETPPQLGLSAKERLSNLKGAFRSDNNFSGMRLLLIDDVMTTGATANECSRELLSAGAKNVVVLTLARTSDK